MSWTAPFVVSVFGFLLAALWIRQSNAGRNARLPTPTQYGLLLALLSGSGLKNVYDAMAYLVFRRRSRPAASSLFHVAILGIAFIVFLTVTVSCVSVLCADSDLLD